MLRQCRDKCTEVVDLFIAEALCNIDHELIFPCPVVFQVGQELLDRLGIVDVRDDPADAERGGPTVVTVAGVAALEETLFPFRDVADRRYRFDGGGADLDQVPDAFDPVAVRIVRRRSNTVACLSRLPASCAPISFRRVR